MIRRAIPSRALIALCILATAQCAPPAPHTPALSGLTWLQALADSGKDLPRPRLPSRADTNAAQTYYEWGTRWGVQADTAEMALFWASRLDPAWAEPLFARFYNGLNALRHDAFETFYATRSSRAAERVNFTPRQMQVLDSLLRLAWERNPFLLSDLEFRGGPPRGRMADPATQAWIALAGKRFNEADSLFGVALKKHPDAILLRLYRAKALFHLRRFDAAVTELEAARDTIRRGVENKLTTILPSVEMFDFAIGIARVQQDDFPSARAAFERALTQNLAFYWAHTRLAGSALELHDTATALSELEMATQLEGRDPLLRLYRGVVLRGAGRLPEAEQELRKAIELDPYYAAPYYWLAWTCQRRGDTTGAVANYREFLRRAARDDPERPNAVHLISALGAQADSS